MGDSPEKDDAKSVRSTKYGKMGNNSKRKQKEKDVELTEEEKAAKKAADRLKFVQNYCTLLKFRNKDGTSTEKLLEGERFETYVELQRALARITPRSMKVFMCLSTDGKVITKDNFKNENAYIIKEMPNAKMEATAKSKFKPQVDIRWEFYDYHGGAPEGWVDRIEVEKKKKEAAARAAKEREKNDAAAAKMMERLVAGDNDDSDAENPFDDL